MKNYLVIILLFSGVHGFSQPGKKAPVKKPAYTAEQVISAGKVPKAVTTKFKVEFPNAVAQVWYKVEGDHYKVIFEEPVNTKQMIEYDKDAKVLRREIDLDISNVPDSITQYYKRNYPEETNYRVRLMDDGRGKMYYSDGTEFGVYFDMNGNLIKHVPKPVEK